MDRASDLFRQMEAAFVDVAWMWAELQALIKAQESNMKRVNLSLNITATMTDAGTGSAMAEFALPCAYLDVPYADALDVQASFMQAINEHGARMLAKGRAHAKAKK